ncbi:MAG: vWA domain-containing protein, partial [Verrucomicrobiota bacterium]
MNTIGYGLKRMAIMLGLLIGVSADAQWTTATRDKAETGKGGLLKKIWVKTGTAPVYETEAGEKVAARLKQHSKAYFYGEAGKGLMAIGDKPKRKDCAHFGFIPRKDVIVWDTDQALRFIGADKEKTVSLFADPELTDKIGDASVSKPNDPTVEPFPIFTKTGDGKAYEIAFVYTAAGSSTATGEVQIAMQRVVTRDMNKVDVIFVIDITGSMEDELKATTESVGFLIKEFAGRSVTLPDGREEPMLFRIGFLAFRDQVEDGTHWKERIDFHGIADVDGLNTNMKQLVAKGGGDVPESVYAAIQEATQFEWDRESGKSIVLIGDAPPKNPHEQADVIKACKAQFIRVHSIVVGENPKAHEAFSGLSLATGGQTFRIADVKNTETVSKIVDSLKLEQAIAEKAEETIGKWAEGAKLSRDIQEFVFRGILPDFAGRPIPPTVYVSSKKSSKQEVCLYKSKASLYEMLGDMQTDFVGMIEDPSPELMTAIAAGGVEVIAELDPNVLKSILDLD